MAYPYTADGLKAFIKYLADKGKLNANTAGGMRSAVEKILSELDEDERQDLKSLDADDAVQRFLNKNPSALSPDSIAVYRSRFSKALDMLDRFNTSPTTFKVNGSSTVRGGQPLGSPKQKGDGQIADKAGPTEKGANGTNDQPVIDRIRTVTLTFPLRDDFMAQLIVPKNLTRREAEKLSAFLALVSKDFDE
jgi:hypothetical protein